MIRAVLDTNVVISGLLWSGTPRRLIEAVRHGNVRPIVSEIMLDELRDVIARSKFSKRLQLIGKTTDELLAEYIHFSEIIEVLTISPVIQADPDDDHVLACAISGKAPYIVSGDPHLLDLIQYQGVKILDAAAFLALLSKNQS